MNPLEAKNYVLMVAKSITADHAVTDDELRRIYEVMAALDVHSDSRIEILNYLFLNLDGLKSLSVPDAVLRDDDVRLSLAKDTIFVREQAQNDDTHKAAEGILAALNITAQQRAFLMEWVAWENQALRRLGAGEIDLADAGSVKELAARAASVGIPLSALYMAGTVGFGAAGITSGLAALGSMSSLTLLGLNPMTAGIAALIVAGISIKKIADFALTKDKKREAEHALLEGKKIQARFRRFLVDDLAEYDSEDIAALFAGRETMHIKARRQLGRLLRTSVATEVE